jgi:glycosyltransferase involved in cell wall biosynthesis
LALKRVCMIVTNPGFPDDIRVHREALALSKSFSVSVIGWDRNHSKKENEYIQGVEVVRIHSKSSYGYFNEFVLHLPFFWFLALINLIKLKVDAVHCHDLDTLPVGIFFKLINWRARLIFDAHEHYPSMISKQVPAFISKIVAIFFMSLPRLADSVIVVNNYLSMLLSKCKKVTIVMNCPALDESSKSSPLLRTSREFRIFYFGGLSENKGIYKLLKLAESREDVRLLIAGDGPAKDDILESSKVHKNITYLGWISYQEILDLMSVSQLIPIMYFSDVLNNKIATPNKLFLAMRFAKPVVVFSGSLTAFIVNKQQMGLVVQEGNDEEFFEKIGDLIDNPRKAQAYGVNGQKAFYSKYNWQVMHNRLLDLYLQLFP